MFSFIPPPARKASGCKGITLIELVVAFAVLTLLMSLLLPAAQMARESARRLDCQNRHRQVALALHNFHETHGHLPGPASSAVGPPAFPRMLSEWAHVLPFLDQTSLYRQIDQDPTESGARAYPGAPNLFRPVNQRLLHTPLLAVVCPSDVVPKGGCNLRVCRGTLPIVDRNPSAPRDGGRRGVFSSRSPTRPTRFGDVTDGLSQTMMLSEKLVGDFDPAVYTPHRDVYFHTSDPLEFLFDTPDELAQACFQRFTSPVRGETSYGGATWLLGGKAYTSYNHVLTPNARTPDCSNRTSFLGQAAVTARSWHHGGVNGALADGSVRFVSESIDLRVWRAIGTRAGAEIGVEF